MAAGNDCFSDHTLWGLVESGFIDYVDLPRADQERVDAVQRAYDAHCDAQIEAHIEAMIAGR